MESRLIFESDKTYHGNVKWKKNLDSESEWNYLNSETLNQQEIVEIINKVFSNISFYLVVDKKTSSEINKLNLIEKIKTLYGKIDFKVWDKNFENILEFSKEVYRYGKKGS